jgi:predicted DNA-binding transcriptional regulator YafY
MRKASRPTLVRWIQILSSLRSDLPPAGYKGLTADWKANARQFAKALECSHRTILRDVDALRDCGYILEYEETDHTIRWVNKNGIEPLPLMAATEDEVIALITALAISHSVLDTGTADKLRTFLLKLEQHLDGQFLHSFDDIQRTIHYQHVHLTPSDTALWTKLQRCILDQRAIEVAYSSPHEENTPRNIRAMPLQLVNLESNWYLNILKISDQPDDSHGKFRLLKLARIQEVRELPVQVPEEWDREVLRDRNERGIGAWQGGEEEGVRLRIAEDKIGFMRERAWYPGHHFEPQEDGSWILSFTASNTDRLAPFVLQWAPDLEVLEPEHLRQQVAWLAGQAARLHGDQQRK